MLGCAVSVGHRANALLINNALLSCPALTGGFHALNKASRAPMELNTHTQSSPLPYLLVRLPSGGLLV